MFRNNPSNSKFVGFITLPTELAEDQDFVYPRRNLMHKFDDIEKQKIAPVLFKTDYEQYTNDYKEIEVADKELQCNLMLSTIKSIKDFLPPVIEKQGSDRSQTNEAISSMHQFFSSYYFEVICSFSMVVRSKLDINVDELNALFPKLKHTNLRQVNYHLFI